MGKEHKELKQKLLDVVAKQQRFESIYEDKVTFLKAGLMLVKTKSGLIKLYETHGMDDYIEINNTYILELIVKDYENKLEEVEEAICRNTKLEDSKV